MPLVNIAAAHTRNQVSGITSLPVNSIGIGTDSTAEALTFTQIGTGAANSDWKNTSTTATRTDSTATDTAATTNPFWQLEGTWGVTEFNGKVVFEIATGWGSLSGADPVAEASKLYTRKRVGGTTGLGKTADYALAARVKVTYPSA